MRRGWGAESVNSFTKNPNLNLRIQSEKGKKPYFWGDEDGVGMGGWGAGSRV